MKLTIQRLAIDLGFDACRFTSAAPPSTAALFERWLGSGKHGEMVYLARNAHKRVDPQLVLAGARTVITLAVSYHQSSNRSSFLQPRAHTSLRSDHFSTTGVVARYAQYADYHDILGARLKTLSAKVDELGGPGTRSLWYVDTGPILERDLAQRSGLGFVGKHTNLISRELGNWFLLAEILTTLELDPDQAEHNRCGSCSRCLSACPTGAITAPFQLDARRCISYLTIELKGAIPVELRPAMGNRIYGCDDCLAACPWNRFAQEGRMLAGHTQPGLHEPDLLELLALSEAEFKERFRHTPLYRTKRRGLLRNVCVALGNTGAPSALPALDQAASDPEPLIGEHARWAIEQIRGRSG